MYTLQTCILFNHTLYSCCSLQKCNRDEIDIIALTVIMMRFWICGTSYGYCIMVEYSYNYLVFDVYLNKQ